MSKRKAHASKSAPKLPATLSHDLSSDLQAMLSGAIAQHRAGQLDMAQAVYEQILRGQPNHPDALHLLGLVAHQRGDQAGALSLIQRAIRADSSSPAFHSSLGLVYAELKNYPAAIASYDQALARKPDFAAAHYNQGNAWQLSGDPARAAACFQQALALQDGYAGARTNLGNAYTELGQLDLAADCFREALRRQPGDAGSCFNLANTLARQGKLEEAVRWFERAVALDPALVDARNNLGNALLSQSRFGDAISVFRQALAVAPDRADIHNNLGNAYRELDLQDDACAAYAHALRIDPSFAKAQNNLGITLKERGRMVDALACFDKALALDAGLADVASNILVTAQYTTLHAPDALFALSQRYAQQFEAPLKPHWPRHAGSRHLGPLDPGRRLRVGYVSADFCDHAVACFIEPVIERHDRSQVEVFCYYNNLKQDAVSARIMAAADHWLPCHAMADAALAARIEADGIDILVDLSGHSAAGRLTVFARKPAPVQVSYLGYVATTGLSAIDYRLTQLDADPPGNERHYSETLFRLPGATWWCYRPPADMPEVGPLPALKNGYVTFGSTNSLCKLAPEAIALWSALLQANPGARLLLAGVPAGVARQELVARFAACGIDAARLELHGRMARRQFYELHARIDIALDPFPYNGGTTSCDALWLGLPLVCLTGQSFASRMGHALLHCIGLPEMAAANPQAYVANASALAADLPRLASLRANLRARVAASALRDERGFTRTLEEAYRSMWHTYCERAEPEPQAEARRLAFQQAQAHHQAGRLSEAADLYRQILQADPNHSDAHNYLGVIAYQRGQHEQAVDLIRRAITLEPRNPAYHAAIGPACRALNRYPEALAAYQQALALAPNDAGVHNNLGNLYRQMGKFAEAAASFGQSLRLKPDDPVTLCNLGGALSDQGRLDEAEQAFRAALRLRPDYAEAHNSLGKVARWQGKLELAAECCRRAIELNPRDHMAHSNLAGIHKIHGQTEEALAHYRRALEIKPDYADGFSNMLFAMQYSELLSTQALFAETLRYGAQFEAPFKPGWQPHANPRDPGRRLRVGYVSADFSQHAVAYFIEPVLARHDKSQFEVFCYDNDSGARHDRFTARIQAAADHWVPCHAMSDSQLAERIRADGIDILVDLSGHTAGNRLPAFARKPAPLQLTWLGYFGSTGLSAMDYRFTDQHMDPPGFADTIHTETLLRLPHFSPFQPAEGSPPVQPLPALSSGKLTFASLNNLSKLNRRVVRLWARILAALPDAGLMLCNIGDGLTRRLLLEMFAQEGIAPERLILQPWMPILDYLALHHAIDLALDPFPYNGGTITNHSLWMGVPVVTLEGDRPVGRIGASLMARAGLPQFIAHSEDDYLDCVLRLAADLPGLNQIRLGLRERMASNLSAGAAPLTRSVEQAYRDIWRAWCAGAGQEPNRAPRLEVAAQADVQARIQGKAQAEAQAQAREQCIRGSALMAQGQAEAAIACYRAALALRPDFAPACLNMGNALFNQGQWDAATEWCNRAAMLDPGFAEPHNTLGAVALAKGDCVAAAASFRRALELKPDFAEPHSNLGTALKELGQLTEAMNHCRKALALKPRYAEASVNLGDILQAAGRLDGAVECYRQALAWKPGLPGAQSNLGSALQLQGKLAEAQASYRAELALNPRLAMAHSNLLYLLSIDGACTPAQYLEQARRYGAAVALEAQPFTAWPVLAQGRRQPQPLRVGVVSGDLLNHPVGFFLESLLQHLDPAKVALFAYPTHARADDLTARIQPRFAAWSPLCGLTDRQAAQKIHDDGIHVLLDLAGHTAHNRLPLFAWKPAPLQVAWLGYWASTGVAAMDWLLADPVSAPAAWQGHFTEPLWHLPDTRLCFSPPHEAPLPGELPALRNGCLTFASFQNLFKVTDAVLALWARVLLALPTARLRLQNKQMGSPPERRALEQRLLAHGIALARVDIFGPAPRAAYLAAHATVDIVLDTFPCSGGTTTCEALWMGVPTLTLDGSTLIARQGAALLRCAGLDDWVADDGDAFVRAALAHAADLPKLARLRAGMRGRLLGSPLFDAPRFARSLERALQGMWQHLLQQGMAAAGGDAGASRSMAVSEAVQAGLDLQKAGRLAQAEAVYRQVLQVAPQQPDALHCLGLVQHQTGRHQAAIESIRHAASIAPSAAMHNNLGLALRAGGQPEAALASYRQALALRPDFFEAHSNLLLLLSYHADGAHYLEQARRFGASALAKAQSHPRLRPFTRWPQARTLPDGRLRIGFVSGDLRDHPVGHFLEGVLAQIDPKQIELVAYATQAPADGPTDALTARIQPHFSAWHSLDGLDDAASAAKIHADGIQILIDLAGHTADNRLPVFAWNPAPLQITWLGYWASTGVPGIDAVLADRNALPPAEAAQFSEQVCYLPDTRLCFTQPAEAEALSVGPLPALGRGGLTVGCFQNLFKLTDAVLALWGRIFRQLPAARLRLQNRQMHSPDARAEILLRLAAAGIVADRVELHGSAARGAYLAAHGEVDLILDTFPYAGGATTCDALWMGVPTLSLCGQGMLGRQGAALLAAAGLDDWIAADADDYERRCLLHAADLPRLAQLRQGLRAQLRRSPLCDAARFAAHWQDLLQQLWQAKLQELSLQDGEAGAAHGLDTPARPDPAAPPDGQGEPGAGGPQQRAGTPLTVAEAYRLARTHHREGRLQQADALYRQILQVEPDQPETLHSLGLIAHKIGKFQVAADLFKKALALAPDADKHCDLGGAHLELGQVDEAAADFARAVALSPNSSGARNNLAVALQKLGRLDEAITQYRHAIACDPNHLDARSNLGLALYAQGKAAEAMACYRETIALKPDFAPPYVNLGVALQEAGQYAAALDSLRQALALAPGDPDVYYNLGVASQFQGQLDEALACYRKARELAPNMDDATNNMGMLLLYMGRFEEGWRCYLARSSPRLKKRGVTPPVLPFPEWRGEPLDGKSVLVWREQGLGDEIQFCRYAPLLKRLGAVRVTQVCNKLLLPLFATLDGVDAVQTPEQTVAPHDYWCFPQTLPLHFGTTPQTVPATVPYLHADPGLSAQMAAMLGAMPGIKVGICWKGSAGYVRDAQRSVGLGPFQTLFDLPGVRFFTLQPGTRAEFLAVAGPAGHDLGHEIDALGQPFAETAALMMALDLVITCDTSIGHLAGALGRPVWEVLPFVADWRWMAGREDSPWYPHTRLFRQRTADDWAEVFVRVRAALGALAA